jgi:hypothetical protein
MTDTDLRALDHLIADIQFSCWHAGTVDWAGRSAYDAPNLGSRRSRNAATPSAKSGVAAAADCICASSSSC